MDILNGKQLKQSLVKNFYQARADFMPSDNLLLNHRNAHRWFDLLKYGAETDLYNFQEIMQGKSGAEVIIRDKPFYMMSSYDYLGLIGHPEIEAAAIDAIHEYGTGTGGVRLLTGTNELHCLLEKKISSFKQTEATMVLSSGYVANIAAIAGLFGKNDIVIADENIHRSITDAIKVAAVPCDFFKHNNTTSLKELLEKNSAVKRKLIIIEGVYSMDGDIAPLPEILNLKKEYNAFLMVDEAHSLGILGAHGKGLNEHFKIAADDIDIFTGSLSKAIPANGGFITAKEEVIIYLKHGGAPFMFSAALSPANTAASLKAFDIIDKEPWRLKKLKSNTAQMLYALKQAQFDTANSQSAVIPVICGSNEKAFILSKKLFDSGFLASSVIYPAVPINKARLRLCCTAAHTEEIINRFTETISKIYQHNNMYVNCTTV